MTPVQVKAARKLLGWSRDRVAGATNIPSQALANFENGVSVPSMTPARLAAIRTALEAAGIEFTDGDNPGVNRRQASP